MLLRKTANNLTNRLFLFNLKLSLLPLTNFFSVPEVQTSACSRSRPPTRKKPNLPQRKTETTVIRPHSQLSFLSAIFWLLPHTHMWLFIHFSNKTHHLNFFLSSKSLSVLLCLVYKSVWFVFFFLFFSLPSAWSFCISLLRKDWGTGKPSYSSDLYIKTKLRDFCFRKLKRIINSLAHSNRRTVDVVVGA